MKESIWNKFKKKAFCCHKWKVYNVENIILMGTTRQTIKMMSCENCGDILKNNVTTGKIEHYKL